MENLKIRVANEVESREAQELFFELGYDFYFGGKLYCNTHLSLVTANKEGLMANIELDGFEYKEITLPQLRDLVVLKRNDIKDATHIRCDGKKYLHVKSTGCYYQFSDDGEWILSTWMNYQLLPQLKPISEQQMASHNIEQQAPRLYLDPTQNYVEIEWDGSFMKQDHWVEVPDGAELLTKCGLELIFWKGDGQYSFHTKNSREWDKSGGALCDLSDYMDDSVQIVWQRTQDEPFLTPESVVKREVHSKNVVEKANEFSERLKKLEYQVGTMGLSASGGANLMPRNSAESISIHGTIESELDFDSELEKALDVQIGGNHYKSMKIQPVEFALANNLDFCQGSAIKYILRHAEKGGKQDLEKAKHFIDLMIQHYYG